MEIPKNVVQTGDVDACHKIYIEDYVHTYMMQSRERDGSSDFCLYGKGEVENGIHYYFIFGAVMEDAGWEMDGRRYFSQWEQIGEATCDESEAWLFFSDGYAGPMDGYFIFYEQNEDMQTYLIAMHQNRPAEDADKMRSSVRTGKKLPDTKMTHEMAEKQAAVSGSRKINSGFRIQDLKAAASRLKPQEGMDQPGSLKAAEIRKHSLRSQTVPQGRNDRQADRVSRQDNNKGRTVYFIRLAGLALLLAVCAAGVISVNRYQDMKEAGNLFAGAAQELDREAESLMMSAADSNQDSRQSSFTVEEKQLQTAENTTYVQPDESVQEPVTPTQEEVVQTPASADTPVPAADSGEVQTPVPAADSGEVQTPVPAADSGQVQTLKQSDAAVNTAEEQGAVSAISVNLPETYTIQSGDNLAAISRRFYGNVGKISEICSLNNIADPNRITPGQKIILPR